MVAARDERAKAAAIAYAEYANYLERLVNDGNIAVNVTKMVRDADARNHLARLLAVAECIRPL